ncbi:hypothetical protein MITS9504_00641 [Synechococcus sp. MIT S9504]|nr:hypothetical protein MITS9504_00641 [Synechococcus sp. MIT S9504]
MGLWPTLCILAHKDPSEGSEFVLCLLFLLLMYQSNRSELYSATCKLDVSVSESFQLIFFALLWLSIIALRFAFHGYEGNFVLEVLSLFRGC